MAGQDTVDIEDLAEHLKSDFVTYFSGIARAALLVQFPWLAGGGSFLMVIFDDIIKNIITQIGTTGGLVAFMFNTKVFTTDQGSDYLSEVHKVNSLPEDVSDDDWDKAELAKIHAFGNLVNFRK